MRLKKDTRWMTYEYVYTKEMRDKKRESTYLSLAFQVAFQGFVIQSELLLGFLELILAGFDLGLF